MSLSKQASKVPQVHSATGHFSALDGLRGAAILMVIAHHLFRFKPPASDPHVWFRAFANSSWIGVDLFFALSGFLITGILIDTVRFPNFFLNFYMRRFLRVFPLYYLALGLVYSYCRMQGISWQGQGWRLLTYTNHIFISPHTRGFQFEFGHGVDINGFWSLAVEEQFYFLWPLLVFWLRRPRKLLPIAFLLSAMSLLVRAFLFQRGVAPDVIYVSLASRADTLLLGGALALATRTRYQVRARSIALLSGGISAAALLIAFVHSHGLFWDDPSFALFGYTAVALVSVALITLALQPGLFSRFFNLAVLRWFGRYSYGIYVWQILPMFYGAPLFALIARSHHVAAAKIFGIVCRTTLPILAAVASFHLIEAPFLKLKRYFSYKNPAGAEPRVAVIPLTAIRHSEL